MTSPPSPTSAPCRHEAFPPIAAPHAHTLILGSMPGAASLHENAYYAHPRNLFWSFIEHVLAIPATLPYDERCAALAARGYALWDVLAACRRPGSLDQAIERDSIEVNDFASFLATHPYIERIFFNGGYAEQVFRRHALPTLQSAASVPALFRLPSTSPANASIPLARKRAAWEALAR